MYHQVKSEIDIHVNYGSGCPNIVRCYGYFYDEKRWDRTRRVHGLWCRNPSPVGWPPHAGALRTAMRVFPLVDSPEFF